MKIFVKNTASVFLITLSFVLISGCGQKNPALQVNADTFAEAVNTFEGLNIGNEAAANCGEYYMNPTNNPFGAGAKADCDHFTIKLAAFLEKNPHFSGITSNDLQSKATWEHYFQSKKAHGRG